MKYKWYIGNLAGMYIKKKKEEANTPGARTEYRICSSA